MAARETPLSVGTGKHRPTEEEDGNRMDTEGRTTTTAVGRDAVSTASLDKETVEEPEPASSSRRSATVSAKENAGAQEEEGICWSGRSAGRIKTPHTYRERCDKYTPGATRAEMIQAARGEQAGRKRLMDKLGKKEEQPLAVEPHDESSNKKMQKTKPRKNSTSSGTSSTRERGAKRPTRKKVGKQMGQKEEKPACTARGGSG